MKRLLLLALLGFLFLTITYPTYCKNRPEWHTGNVVFLSGDSLACQLKFTRKVSEGLLQILNGSSVRILTVKEVKSFSYYDEKQKRTRRFINVSLMPELSTRKHEIFIEDLYGNGVFSILNHRTIGYAENSIAINPFRKKTVVNHLYILDNSTGEVLPLSKENILAVMQTEKEQVTNYLEKSRTKLKSVSDYIALLEYHKSLDNY